MKKFLILMILALVPVFVYSQTSIFYKLNPVLTWDVPTGYENGDPFLPEDIISYEVFLWNSAMGSIEAQEVENLLYFGTTLNNQITLSFPNRFNWVAGVRYRVTDGAGNTRVADLAYTTNIEDVADQPFMYAPDIQAILKKLTNLQDSGI